MQSIWLLFFILFAASCNSGEKKTHLSEEHINQAKEAHEDSLALIAAYAAQDKIAWSVTAKVETRAIHARKEDDAADDPAIWVNRADPSKSLVYGSNKKGGLAVYDLNGEEINYYPIGNINNVDILYDFPFGDSLITLLGCSNRSDQSIDLFKIDPRNGNLQNIAFGPLAVDTALVDDIYGFCFAQAIQDGTFYCIINGKNGLLQQFELFKEKKGVSLELKRFVQFDSQTEGMVADNEYGFLYVGEEGNGIWKLGISPSTGNEKTRIDKSDATNPNIVYDIEGLSIYKYGDSGFLVASSQGNFSYAVFERKDDNKYLGSFKITPSERLDGVEETDGVDIVSDSLGLEFPKGMMVVQDGFNYSGDQIEPQNFKYVDWHQLMPLFQTLTEKK